MVTEVDCGTDEGLLMTPVIDGGDIIESLADGCWVGSLLKDVLQAWYR